MKLEYKPIAVQDECWGGKSVEDPEVTVLIKLEAQGKTKKHYKITAETFPNASYLDKFITENNLVVVPEKEFKATEFDKVLAIIKQSTAS